MEGDPFKRRYPLEKPKKVLLLSKYDINRIISHAQIRQTEEEKEAAAREDRQRRRQESQKLNAAMSQRKEPGSDLKKKQYELGAKFAKVEMDRENRTEARKNLVLEQAYKRLFEDTDRVKYFKTAKNFAEMMKERNDQIATKATHKDEEAKYDAKFFLETMRDVDQHKWEGVEKERIKERNKEKNAGNWRKQHNESCPTFWPQSGCMQQGNIKIQHLVSEAEYFGGVLVRKFSVKNPKGKRRTIKTFHLHGWRREDFVPPQVDTIVQLIAKVEKWTRKSGPAPILVTCYDGCRASGFYCAASYLAAQIHDTLQADVIQAVRTVRLHRPTFIPTVEQYRWLYELSCFLVSEKILK